jgi:DNA-binding transcriptional ArsR family regulator
MKRIKSTKFDGFSNEIRVKLLICLQDEKSVTELLELCDLSQSALSQHLKILKDAQLVSCRREGKKQIYKVINKEVLFLANKLIQI